MSPCLTDWLHMITALKPTQQQQTHTQTQRSRRTQTDIRPHLLSTLFVLSICLAVQQTCFSAFLNAAKNRWCLRKDTMYTHIQIHMHMHVLYILMYRYDTYLFLCGLNIIVAIVYNKNVGPAETCNTFYALRLNTSSSLSTSPPPSRLFSANVLLLVRLQRRRMANDLYHTYKQTHTHTER